MEPIRRLPHAALRGARLGGRRSRRLGGRAAACIVSLGPGAGYTRAEPGWRDWMGRGDAVRWRGRGCGCAPVGHGQGSLRWDGGAADAGGAPGGRRVGAGVKGGTRLGRGGARCAFVGMTRAVGIGLSWRRVDQTKR